MSSLFSLVVLFGIIATVFGVLAATRNGRPSLTNSGYQPTLHPTFDPNRQITPGYQAPGYAQPAYGQIGPGYGQMVHPYPQPITPGAQQAIDADITTFGDELRDLDLDVVGRDLDDAAEADYSRALDAYDGAKNQLAQARTSEDIRRIAEILEDGRYAIACVKARAHGQPVPEHRPPCFFDPAHGVSVANVSWAPPGGAPREVPACAADAQRIRTGNDPSIRMVPQAHGQVPYWEDQQHAAWAQGYYGRYGQDPTLRTITQGALMIGGFSLLMGLLDD